MIIPVGFAQVTHTFSSGFLPFGAVTTYGVDLDLVITTLDTLASNLYDNFQDHVMGNLSSAVNHDVCRIKAGPNTTGPVGEFTGVEVGGAGGTFASPNLAYLVEKNTALGGRRGRGRMFLPGVTESGIGSAGGLDSTVASDFATNLGNWFDTFAGAGVSPVLLHSDATSPTPITSFTIDPTVATQRNRLRR